MSKYAVTVWADDPRISGTALFNSFTAAHKDAHRRALDSGRPTELLDLANDEILLTWNAGSVTGGSLAIITRNETRYNYPRLLSLYD